MPSLTTYRPDTTDDERRVFASMHPERGFTYEERDSNVTLVPWESISPVQAELKQIYAAIEARQ